MPRKKKVSEKGQTDVLKQTAATDASTKLLHELRFQRIKLELQNVELRHAQKALDESRARYFDLYDLAPVGYLTLSERGLILEANLTAATLLGETPGMLDKQPFSRFILKEDQDINYLYSKKLFKTGEPQECELRLVKPDGALLWAHLRATTAQAEDGARLCRVVISDISKRKQAEKELKRMEWMLSKKPISNIEAQTKTHDQGYGDLTELNRDGIILKSLGHERLKIFANDYLELLGTSSAIYEMNGDYAFGIFASGWCRMMDKASRKLCGTPENVEALNSGRWLCHESCWTDCAKEALAKRAEVDIECRGGIRMYAAPIFAGGDVIGVINFGYGDPPKDPEKLKMLADAYRLDQDDLFREATAYDSRPPYIIELAKSRLKTTAKLIGSMVETRQAMEALRESEEKHRRLFETMGPGVVYHSADGRIISANPSAQRILGLTLDQMNGKTSMDPRWTMIKEDGSEVSESDHPAMIALRTGETVGPGVWGLFYPDKNAHIWLSITAIPLFQPGESKPFQAYATFEDITERKEARPAGNGLAGHWRG